MANYYNYNYENDSSSNINTLDNNSIKISIYTNSNFICINCWNKYYKRLKEIY